jgi:hypothetical protein
MQIKQEKSKGSVLYSTVPQYYWRFPFWSPGGCKFTNSCDTSSPSRRSVSRNSIAPFGDSARKLGVLSNIGYLLDMTVVVVRDEVERAREILITNQGMYPVRPGYISVCHVL